MIIFCISNSCLLYSILNSESVLVKILKSLLLISSVITSNLLLNSRFSNSELSFYYNRKSRIFSRDKLVKIPLEKWKKEDIKKWLTKYGNPRLKNTDKDTIAEKIYNATDKGRPTDVCLALQQKQWQNLT